MFKERVALYTLEENEYIFLGAFLLTLDVENKNLEFSKLEINSLKIEENGPLQDSSNQILTEDTLEVTINNKIYFIKFLSENKRDIFQNLVKIADYIQNPNDLVDFSHLVEIIFKDSLLQFINRKDCLYSLFMLHDTCLIEKVIEKIQPAIDFAHFKAKMDFTILLDTLKEICDFLIFNADMRIILCNFLLLTIAKYDLIICLNGILSQTINIITVDLNKLIFCDEMFISLSKSINSKHIDLNIEKLFSFLFKHDFKTDLHLEILIFWIEKYKKNFTDFITRDDINDILYSIQRFLNTEKDYLLFYEFLRHVGKYDSDSCLQIFQNFSILFPIIKYLNYENDRRQLLFEDVNLLLENEESINFTPINLTDLFDQQKEIIKTNRMHEIKMKTKKSKIVLCKHFKKIFIFFEKLSDPPFSDIFMNYLLTTNFLEFLFLKNYKKIEIEFFKYKILHNFLLRNLKIKNILEGKEMLNDILKVSLKTKEYFIKKGFTLIVALIDEILLVLI